VIERTDNVKTALTQLAQQVSSSGKAIKSLTWRMNSGDGFLPMALLKAEPGATVHVEMMEGGWSSGDGSAACSATAAGGGLARDPRNVPMYITSLPTTPAVRLEAWITPPAYTGAAPIFLDPAGGAASVPAGSRLQVAPGAIIECHVPPYEPEFDIELVQTGQPA
jgi:hypothetical protein